MSKIKPTNVFYHKDRRANICYKVIGDTKILAVHHHTGSCTIKTHNSWSLALKISKLSICYPSDFEKAYKKALLRMTKFYLTKEKTK